MRQTFLLVSIHEGNVTILPADKNQKLPENASGFVVQGEKPELIGKAVLAIVKAREAVCLK